MVIVGLLFSTIYTNAQNTANRLKRFNDVEGKALYHPPKLYGRYRAGDQGDYVLSVGRLEKLKRLNLLIDALPHSRPVNVFGPK